MFTAICAIVMFASMFYHPRGFEHNDLVARDRHHTRLGVKLAVLVCSSVGMVLSMMTDQGII